ncbi:phosphotransferase [Marinobacter sp. BGYM27]|uniref:phosphotransferase n=1 Tax=Marinobacter sp. BGYM27 TaxID=2975597 RepID=UPI0021A69C03|nr:phosphotransferase [Marinobacter sp. BGYM27]MDG5500035.1 phosphotransferase [Marinobacter sp. BGYM27]
MYETALERALEELPGHWQRHLREAEICPVEGGLCNTLFQVRHPSGDVALRVNHPDPEPLGVDHQREHAMLDLIADNPWAPHLRYASNNLMVTDWVGGDAPVGGELTRLHWLAHALTSVHACSETTPVPSLQTDIPTLLLRFATRCPQRQATGSAVEQLLEHYQPPSRRVLCHHDWHPGNLILSSSGWTLLDWEFAGFGDPCLDAGSAINGFALNPRQIERLAQLTGFSVDNLVIAARIMDALEVVWFAANPALTHNSAERLDNWLNSAHSDCGWPNHKQTRRPV